MDYKKKYDVNYCNANLFEIFDERLEDLNLIQLVKFDTWSRIVGLECRSSVLDHIYVNCVSLIQNVCHSKPIFGDQELVTAELCIIKPVTKVSVCRDWRHYSKEKLNNRLGVVDWSNNAHDVQELWNDFEVKIIRVIKVKLYAIMHREKQYFKPKGMSPCCMKHLIIAGLFYNVTFVMMKGPNKSILKLKKEL